MNNYTYSEEQLAKELETYPHLVPDCLNTIKSNHDSDADNTQGAVVVALCALDRYTDVSKTKMIKLVASVVKHGRLTAWVSKRKFGFVPAGQVKEPTVKKNKNKGGRLGPKQRIEKEEREAALKEYRLKVRARIRKQYGLK